MYAAQPFVDFYPTIVPKRLFGKCLRHLDLHIISRLCLGTGARP